MWVSLLLLVSIIAGPIYPPPKDLWTPSISSVPLFGDYFYFLSSESYLSTPLNSVFSLSLDSGLLEVQVAGDQRWTGIFQVMSEISTLELGYYQVQRFPSQDQSIAGLLWVGGVFGSECTEVSGWVVIDEVGYRNATLDRLKLRFEEICGENSVLHGAIRWLSSDHRQPPGPQPTPSNLWTPSVSLPGGNVIYLESQDNDYIGRGLNHTYTYLNSILTIEQDADHFKVKVHGNEEWTGYFQPMSSVEGLKEGFYGNLGLYPGNNPAVGGLNWNGGDRECNTTAGWFAVDDVQYNQSTLTALSMRFAQYCNEQPAALHGVITWAVSNPNTPPDPVFPPPNWLWTPSTNSLPEGNYVYLESDAGDPLLQGQNLSYTSINSVLTFANSKNELKVTVNGDLKWEGIFKGMVGLTTIQPGYYSGLQAYPDNNPALGGLIWSEMGKGCESVTGWFAIDKVAISANGTLNSVSMRFEQHCEGLIPALHGALQWDSQNPVSPPGPQYPPPSNLWTPSIAPNSPVYLYLESDPGDTIGQGRNYTYLSDITVTESSGYLSVTVTSNDTWWVGAFQVMNSLSQIETGYYGDLERYPYQNPVKGGLAWTCDGRGCSTGQGWVAVDQVSYGDDGLASLQLRFEQVCDDMESALHGALSWQTNSVYF